MANPTPHFKFLELPREIRLMVYERLVTIGKQHFWFESTGKCCEVTCQTSILRTCRGIYEEAQGAIIREMQRQTNGVLFHVKTNIEHVTFMRLLHRDGVGGNTLLGCLRHPGALLDHGHPERVRRRVLARKKALHVFKTRIDVYACGGELPVPSFPGSRDDVQHYVDNEEYVVRLFDEEGLIPPKGDEGSAEEVDRKHRRIWEMVGRALNNY